MGELDGKLRKLDGRLRLFVPRAAVENRVPRERPYRDIKRNEGLLSIREAAVELGISERLVMALIDAGRIEARRVENRRYVVARCVERLARMFAVRAAPRHAGDERLVVPWKSKKQGYLSVLDLVDAVERNDLHPVLMRPEAPGLLRYSFLAREVAALQPAGLLPGEVAGLEAARLLGCRSLELPRLFEAGLLIRFPVD